MKKYLFLLFLFIIYLLLTIIVNSRTKPVISYNKENESVISILLKFEDGINSKKLSDLFNSYNNEYYIYNIKLKNENIDLSCNHVDSCLEEIFSQEDNYFGMLNITNGFKINEVEFLAYKDEIFYFLDKNKLVYEIK